jgi:hypothetical protein
MVAVAAVAKAATWVKVVVVVAKAVAAAVKAVKAEQQVLGESGHQAAVILAVAEEVEHDLA